VSLVCHMTLASAILLQPHADIQYRVSVLGWCYPVASGILAVSLEVLQIWRQLQSRDVGRERCR
jgi:hypothetical protein